MVSTDLFQEVIQRHQSQKENHGILMDIQGGPHPQASNKEFPYHEANSPQPKIELVFVEGQCIERRRSSRFDICTHITVQSLF